MPLAGRPGLPEVESAAAGLLRGSIYYDRHGHDYLAATDMTRHTTQTVRTNVPKMTYLHARLFAWVYNDVTPPLADTPIWQFTNSPRNHLQGRSRHPRRPVDYHQVDRLHRRRRIRHRDSQPVRAEQRRPGLHRLVPRPAAGGQLISQMLCSLKSEACRAIVR